jgi:hypothetical protein
MAQRQAASWLAYSSRRTQKKTGVFLHKKVLRELESVFLGRGRFGRALLELARRGAGIVKSSWCKAEVDEEKRSKHSKGHEEGAFTHTAINV